MTRMIAFLSIVIVLFAVAAGGSWYLQTQQAKDGESPRSAEERKGKAGGLAFNAKSSGDAASGRPLIRSAPSSETDRLTQLAATLQRQQEALKDRETQIATREKQMDIVHDDIKKEQRTIEAARKEIQVELRLVQEKLELLEKRSAEGDKDRKYLEAEKEEIKGKRIDVEALEWNNLKQQIKAFDKMEPETASQVIVQMVDQGKKDVAVKIMSQVRDRQAAAIYAEITKQDAKLAGELFERSLGVKSPTLTLPK